MRKPIPSGRTKLLGAGGKPAEDAPTPFADAAIDVQPGRRQKPYKVWTTRNLSEAEAERLDAEGRKRRGVTGTRNPERWGE